MDDIELPFSKKLAQRANGSERDYIKSLVARALMERAALPANDGLTMPAELQSTRQ
jgi:hypothetical protein